MPDLAEPSIMLIDRDDIVRDSIRVLLESHDFSVREFHAPEEFLAVDAPARCTCVVLGLHGNIADALGLLHAMRKRRLNVPVILVSGDASATARQATAKAGAFAHIERPVQEAILLQTIRAATTGRPNQPY